MDNSFSSQDRYDHFDTAPCYRSIIQQMTADFNCRKRYIYSFSLGVKDAEYSFFGGGELAADG